MGTDSRIIVLEADGYRTMLDEALRQRPREACGLVAGENTEDGAVIRRVYCLRNCDESAEHFSLDPAEQLAAVKDMRSRGLVPLGNWHSHPETPSRPSAEDIRLAYDSRAIYLILSLAQDEPILRAFHIEEGRARMEVLRVEERDED